MKRAASRKPPARAFSAGPSRRAFSADADAEIVELADARTDALAALSSLAEALGAPKTHSRAQQKLVPAAMSGKLEPASVAAVLAELCPDDAIIVDEAATAGLAMFPMTAGMARHDWLMLTGGSIGFGLPAGVGAAIACPERKVICLQADGSAMYTVQALWTMAREKLDVTTVIFNNASYAILNIELARVGVQDPGPKALSLLDLSNPMIDWVEISTGMGVPAVRAKTAEEFRAALKEAPEIKGPRLVEADLRA
jgi:acetolactate synthase-1/2/3 large subunit